VLIVRRSKLYYTASGIIRPIGGRPVHRLREEMEILFVNIVIMDQPRGLVIRVSDY
jgi:hypothetical protein